MEEINPYASPRETDSLRSLPMADGMMDGAGSPVGVWRDGRRLVMHKMAHLPNRCVKTNQPAARWLELTMVWCHPAILLTLLAGPLVPLFLTLVLQKKATIRVGLSEKRFARRRSRAIIGVSVFAGGMSLIPGSAMLAEYDYYPDLSPWLLVIAVLVVLVGGIYALWGRSVVTATRITRGYVWLKGVHRDYLAVLPEWPGKV